MAMIDFDMYEGLEELTFAPGLEEDEDDFFKRRRRGRSSRGSRRSVRRSRRSARRTARRVRKDRRRVSRGKKPKNLTLLNRYKGRSVRTIRKSYRKPSPPKPAPKPSPRPAPVARRSTSTRKTTRRPTPVRRTVTTSKTTRRYVATPTKVKPAPRKTSPTRPAIKPSSVKLSQMGTVTSRGLKEHLVANKAIQNELKTKQEVQKARGLQKKVEQEELKTEGIAMKVDAEKFKTEKLKAQTQMISTGKGLIWIGVFIGGYFFVTKVLMKDFKPKKGGKPTKAKK